VSLYALQKFVYHLNRDRDLQARFKATGPARWPLRTSPARNGPRGRRDVGLLYVLGSTASC